ncbi:ParH-like protein [Kitasatospora sp. NBC_01302]|uniref:ParH-like protein n=1 Tax=Kitasatospora sp. NBC_01302 TaxID=2903575 RepID=UPI002E167CAB|nr:ParH-like protein [Kitasatospora sp. NBC_01302]
MRIGWRTRRGRTWQRCQQTVDALELPAPFDAVRFIAGLAEQRGRPIELIPVSGRPNLPCGLLVTTDEADCILYAADTTPLHQQHILLHEAAHLICRHHESAPATQTLLPHLNGSLVQRVLGRTVYSEPQEREAELVASLILHRAVLDAGGTPGSWSDSVFGAGGPEPTAGRPAGPGAGRG